MEIYITETTGDALQISRFTKSQLYQSMDCTNADEFILDLACLPSECDYLNLIGDIDKTDKDFSFTQEDSDVPDTGRTDIVTNESGVTKFDTLCASTSSGYESDSEEEIQTPVNKRRRVRQIKYRKNQNIQSKGQKRKSNADDDSSLNNKRMKATSSSGCYNFHSSDTSSSDSDYSSSGSDSSSDSSSCSWSSSASCSSSDSSSSDSDTKSDATDDYLFNPCMYLNPTRRKTICPYSCVCNTGPSLPPPPIQREKPTPVPLYKKLLRLRLLSVANTALSSCCRRHCYLRWLRQR